MLGERLFDARGGVFSGALPVVQVESFTAALQLELVRVFADVFDQKLLHFCEFEILGGIFGLKVRRVHATLAEMRRVALLQLLLRLSLLVQSRKPFFALGARNRRWLSYFVSLKVKFVILDQRLLLKVNLFLLDLGILIRASL